MSLPIALRRKHNALNAHRCLKRDGGEEVVAERAAEDELSHGDSCRVHIEQRVPSLPVSRAVTFQIPSGGVSSHRPWPVT